MMLVSRRHVTPLFLLLRTICYVVATPETIVRRFPSGDTRSCAATITVASNEALWAYEFRSDGEPWRLGPQFSLERTAAGAVISGMASRQVLQHTLSGLKTGAHNIEIRVMDQNGQRDATPFSTVWTVHPPTIKVLSDIPERAVPNSDYWLELKSDSAKYAFEYKINDGAWQLGEAYKRGIRALHGSDNLQGVKFTEFPRAERQRLRMADEGEHTIWLRAVDECGNRGEEISVPFRTAYVTTSIPTKPPSGVISAAEVKFSVQGDTATFGFEYKHNGGPWLKGTKRLLPSSIPAPAVLTGLIDGEHTLQIRAVDGHNRPDYRQHEFSWIVDRTPPVTRPSENGPKIEGQRVSLEWESEDASACTFTYSIDGGKWQPTKESIASFAGLDDGEHVVRVRSIDAAGNEEEEGALFTFAIDASPPTTVIAQAPDRFTSDSDARFWLTASERNAHMKYSLDSAPFQDTGPLLEFLQLDEGQHSLRVYSIDLAGNVEREAVSFVWNIDRVAPRTVIHAGWGTLEQPRFAVSAQPGEGETKHSLVTYDFEYSLDDGEWVLGEKTLRLGPGYEVRFENLSPGIHTLQARSLDRAGNIDLTPATHVFEIPKPQSSWRAPWRGPETSEKKTESATVADANNSMGKEDSDSSFRIPRRIGMNGFLKGKTLSELRRTRFL